VQPFFVLNWQGEAPKKQFSLPLFMPKTIKTNKMIMIFENYCQIVLLLNILFVILQAKLRK
jgi:hypothetical protein